MMEIERFGKSKKVEMLRRLYQEMEHEDIQIPYQRSEAGVLYDSLSENGKKIFQSKAGFGVDFSGDSQFPIASNTGNITSRASQDQEIKRKIAACREAYENEGIVGNIIDIMTDFAFESIDIIHPSRQIQNFYKHWKDTVKLNTLVEQMAKAYFRDGNVPMLTFNGLITPESERRLKRALGQNNKLVKDVPIDQKIIPIKYSLLDVLRLWKQDSTILGFEGFEYQLGISDLEVFNAPRSDEIRQASRRLQEELGQSFDGMLKTGRLPLDPDRVSMLYYKRDGYSKWATPMLWRIIPDLKFKRLLRQMDISVAEGVLNSFLIIKLGKVEEEFIPTAADFSKLATMMKNPSKSKILLWDNLIDIQAEYPPVDKILGAEKYEQVNSDIRSGVGISETLVNGTTTGNFSSNFISVKTLLERLEGGRVSIIEWIKKQTNTIARNMGFRQAPFVKIRGMSLVDEEAEKKLLLELYDRNLISVESLMESFGQNFGIEIQRMRQEDRLRKELEEETPFVIRKTGKFGPFVDSILLDDPVENEIEIPENFDEGNNPSQQGPKGNLGGRPKGTKKRQKIQTKPVKPQGQTVAEERDVERANVRFNKSYDLISKTLCDMCKVSTSKELDKKHLELLYSTIITSVCYITDARSLTPKNIIRLLNNEFDKSVAGAKLDRCVRGVVTQKVAEFKEKNKGKTPSKKKMREITSSAFAICNSQLKD